MAFAGGFHEPAESLFAQEFRQLLPIHTCLAVILMDADAPTMQLMLELSERFL